MHKIKMIQLIFRLIFDFFKAPSTPSHLSGHSIGGGNGQSRQSQLRSPSNFTKQSQPSQSSNQELLKLDKFKSLFQSANLDLGIYLI